MEHEIDDDRYQIRVTGETPEIRNIIISLESVVMGGSALHLLQDDLDSLERIQTPRRYDFEKRIRIEYNRDSLTCYVNIRDEAKPDRFKLMKDLFELALERYEQPT